MKKPSVICEYIGNGQWTTRYSVVRPSDGSGITTVHLNAVSCTSATFCVAVGGDFAYTWNGAKWSTAHVLYHAKPNVQQADLYSVSCVGREFCLAANEAVGSPVFEFNGTGWHDITGPKPHDVEAVSCWGLCAVVDQDAFRYTDAKGHWTEATFDAPAHDNPSINGIISCPSSRFCIAVDDDGDFYRCFQ